MFLLVLTPTFLLSTIHSALYNPTDHSKTKKSQLLKLAFFMPCSRAYGTSPSVALVVEISHQGVGDGIGVATTRSDGGIDVDTSFVIFKQSSLCIT